MTTTRPECFVMMPISDPETYAQGHFQRVYKHAIVPAVVASGHKPVRADEVNSTNFIVVDLLQRIINCPLAVCDLSARNPNVFFELGIRQAFDMPVVLIKDQRTERVFDIQGLRTIEYEDSLRVDAVAEFHTKLTAAISETVAPPEQSINSLIKLLSIQKAEVKEAPHLSQDTSLLLSAIRDLGSRLDSLETTRRPLDSAPGLDNPYLSGGADGTPSAFMVQVPHRLASSLEKQAIASKMPISTLVKDALRTYMKEYDTDHIEATEEIPVGGLQVRIQIRAEQELGRELVRRASEANLSISRYIVRVLNFCVAA